MLILTRKRSETIQIGDDVLIKVIRTGRGSVKLGIVAPENVRVLRGELNDEPTDPQERGNQNVLEYRGGCEPAAIAGARDLARPYIA